MKDNRAAICPTIAANANADGIIDLIGTEPVAGTTMVPFNADPVAMKVPSDTYPKASVDGVFTYRKTVSLQAMNTAFAKAFGAHVTSPITCGRIERAVEQGASCNRLAAMMSAPPVPSQP